ncbi:MULTISPECIES: hypothetical protein [Paraburkholderia]|uniref:hypothetical protein n=1 Tax=Paraburkholderia TaxID=1822464 RepID=UPI00225542AD|nr:MULTISPECIES: hypothetical protein [Paraburkholderia]MCX4165085.1 hypothetical protein [Paraburkholderia megapolitana]MDN7160578.1 hypothetical protein [Paraburkholderia sp. CHISQ3]MDQ6497625.1 hypothetical protein [Paraburkholderia megapolitana]
MATLIGTFCFLFVVIYIAGFFISALPCVLLHLFAAHFRIGNPIFYVVAGGLLGLFGFAIAFLLPSHFSPMRPNILHWYLTRLVPVSCAVGLVYWAIAGRYFRKQANELA